MFNTANMLIASGILGFALYAVSFALVQADRLDGNGKTYTVMNLAAAALTLVSVVEQFNLSALLTQTTWIAVSFVGLVRRVSTRRQRSESSQPTVDSLVTHKSMPAPPVA